MSQKPKLFFLGIGGIGMSALARYFHQRGYSVSGYDKTASKLTDTLSEEGIHVQYEDEITEWAAQCDRIVYTPAVPKNTKLYAYFSGSDKPMHKRAKVLGEICKGYYTIAVAGTHGKTTISSLIAHLLKTSGQPVTAFIGGIMTNYQTNYLSSKEKKFAVIEADEYDRSFLQLHPDIAVISAIDPDHLDIYESADGMLDTYQEFATQVRHGGTLYAKPHVLRQLQPRCETQSYQLEENADFFSTNLHVTNGQYRFNMNYPEGRIEDLAVGLPGHHNVENATVAFAVAHKLGLSVKQIREGLSSFQGIHRRFVTAYQSDKLVVIDDYAHHPKEIEAVISSAREMYPNWTLRVAFQPHLFSRTRDFKEGFMKSLSLADEVYLLDIYPAREEPIPGVNSESLLEGISATKKAVITPEEMTSTDAFLSLEQPTVILILGAGNIDRTVAEVVNTATDLLK